MAFKKVASLDTDFVVSLGGTDKKTGKANPKHIEGYYLGKREVPDRKKKSGVSYIYVFQTPKGNGGVWGKTDMDRKMQSATPGVMTRVEHTGFRATPNGDMYTYDVFIDSDNTIDVPNLSASSTTDETAETYEDSQTYVQDSDTFEDEEPVQAEPLVAAKASPASQARVQALLARKKV